MVMGLLLMTMWGLLVLAVVAVPEDLGGTAWLLEGAVVVVVVVVVCCRAKGNTAEWSCFSTCADVLLLLMACCDCCCCWSSFAEEFSSSSMPMFQCRHQARIGTLCPS